MAPELRVGQLVARYLPATENWIHTLISAVPGASSLVMNRGSRENADRFPSRQVSLADLAREACGPEAAGLERNGVSPTFLAAARDFGCQVLHAHFGTEGALGLPLARALGVPLVTSFYGFDASSLPHERAWKRPLADLFAGGTLFCAEGPVLADRLVALGAPADRVRLMSLPVPPALPQTQEPSELEILICSRFVDKKGVDDSLRAIWQLRKASRRPFKCTLVGDGPQRGELERLSTELGLTDRVTFAGSLNPDEVRVLLSRASILLQMSRTAADGDTEGGAPVILSEAMAHGVACVATHHADIPHVVQHERTGLLVPERDWRSAAAALATLAASARRRRSMGARGRAIASSELAPETCGRRLRACYEEALWRQRRPKRSTIVVSLEAKTLAIDLRIQAKAAAALRHTLGRPLTHGQRIRVLRALAQQSRQEHPAVAAGLLRQARRLKGAEPSIALDEARAWIATKTPGRAASALVAFLRAHSDRGYAWATVCRVALAEAHTPSLLLRVAAMTGTAPARFAGRVATALTSGMPVAAKVSLVRTGTMLLRSSRAAQDRALVEMALAELVAGCPAEALGVHNAGLVTTLAQYRVASTLEAGPSTSRRAARAAFEEIAGHAADPDLRAGAAYHLARLADGAGAIALARQWARRCVALRPNHQAATALLRQLDLRKAS